MNYNENAAGQALDTAIPQTDPGGLGELGAKAQEIAKEASAKANSDYLYKLQQQAKSNNGVYLTLDQIKANDAAQDMLKVYILQRNYEAFTREARLIAAELAMRGYPVEKEEKEDDLSFRKV